MNRDRTLCPAQICLAITVFLFFCGAGVEEKKGRRTFDWQGKHDLGGSYSLSQTTFVKSRAYIRRLVAVFLSGRENALKIALREKKFHI